MTDDGLKVLVTGGAGYIGSHACKALKARGFKPIAFDNLVYGHRSLVRWGPLVEGNVSSPEDLKKVFEVHRPSAVMHFAAYAYVGESVQDPLKYYSNNVAGTLNLLRSMRDFSCRQIVFSSTCAVYGVPAQVPIPESEPLKPINPYGSGKRMVEQVLGDLDSAEGLRFVSLRYFNAAGADPAGEAGENHHPETHLIPIVLEVAAGKRKELVVFGGDYPTPDGTCVRDYIHVTDLADAHVRALEYLQRGGKSVVLNLGTGLGHSVKEIIGAAEKVTGKKISVRMGGRRAGDPPSLVADSSLAGKILGWSPRYSAIETQIETAWRWVNRGT